MGMDLMLSQMDLGVEGREPYLGKLLGGSMPCDGLPTPVCVRSFSRNWRPVGPDLSRSSLRPSPQAGWFVRLVNPFFLQSQCKGKLPTQALLAERQILNKWGLSS